MKILILGASGSGKTTFAQLLAGTLRPITGLGGLRIQDDGDIPVGPADANWIICAQDAEKVRPELRAQADMVFASCAGFTWRAGTEAEILRPPSRSGAGLQR